MPAPLRSSRRVLTRVRVALVVLAVALASMALLVPGSASGLAQLETSGGELFPSGLDDFDARVGTVAPTAAQLALVDGLGATARWNRFGTPRSLIKYGGFLATGLSGDAVQAARGFISANKALFRLSDGGVGNLELLNDSPMAGTTGHAVIFRQRFGNLAATQDGLITIGVKDGKVAYVSSSAAGDGNAPAPATLTPRQAWLKAATNAELIVTDGDISNVREENGWTLFDVQGLAYPQRARLTALPTPTSGVRPAYEAVVLNLGQSGEAEAYTTYVDGRSGKVWFRTNRMNHLAQAEGPTSGTFQGTTAANPPCGILHEFDVPAGTESVDVVASGEFPTDDIVLNLHHPPGTVVATADTLFSPEAIHYAPPVLDPGLYAAEVCQFDPPPAPPINYVGAWFTQDAAGGGFPYPPQWRVFPANPPLDLSSVDTRELWCWVNEVDGVPVPGCERELQNLAARAPWDHDVRTGVPTFTTRGNAAISGEAWLSPLTPAEQYRPVALDRKYDFPWTDQWEDEKCSQTVFASPERNDIDAATTNLFAMHNRMHDWSYFLGFTEENFNMQDSNFGLTPPGPYPAGREVDPEIGNSQAGAVTGGYPSFTGRDNANQITLNDGIPGITNMYLWQPIPAGFYPPCVDGDYDMSVIAHEYTHAISNRMVGGPDSGLTSTIDGQARAMGESYSDITAVEYLLEYGFVPTAGENPFAVGPYVTGNGQTGIRNYGMNASPLNYSDVQGYDGMGSGSPHDDGEIWSATNYDIRQAMIKKYNRQFPASDATLQERCADGEVPADLCPGNRRWIQIMFDAYLLMAPNVDMLDSRDAYLAADVMRFGGANQTLLWKQFAIRGMGENASTTGTDDPQPVPNFETPLGTEGAITFQAVASEEGGAPVNAEIYVGDYEANVTPIADTDPATALSDTASFVKGVTYRFVARADGYGAFRFTNKVGRGAKTVLISMPTNWASTSKGAVATGDGVNHESLIDDTEATNWAALGRVPNVNGTQVTVDLSGGARMVRSVRVSALLRAPDSGNAGDPGSQSRFSALRKFEIYTCTESPTNPGCVDPLGFTKIFTSPDDAFPGIAPRPLAPNLILRSFDVPETSATHVRLVVVTNQCTGGPAYQGEQDNDPLFSTDCQIGSAQDQNVRAAELQVFSTGGRAQVPGDPFVVMTKIGPETAAAGSEVNYQMTYTNLGPEPSSNAKVTDVLPSSLQFLSASDGGTYDAASRTVTWDLGTVPVTFTGTMSLTARIEASAPPGSVIINEAIFTGDLTTSSPGVALTIVQ